MPSSRGSTPPAKSAGPATTVTSAQSRARSGFSGGSFGTPFNTDSTPATERMTRATTAHRTDSQDEIVTRIVDFAEELAVKTWNLMKMGELSEGLGLLASVEDPEMPDFVKIERRAKESMRNKYAQLGDEDFPSSRPRAQSAHSFVSAESTRAAAAAFAQGKPIRTPHSSTPSATIMVPVEMALAPQGKSIAIGVARRGSKWNVKFTEGEAETGELQARSPRFADAASHIGSKVDFATDSLAVGSVLTIDTTRSSSFLDEKIDAGSRRSPSFPSPRRMGSRSRSAAEAKMRARRAKREMMMLIDLHERMEREKHLMSIHELLEQKRKEYHESVVQETIEKSAKSKARRAYLEAQHVLITKHDEEVRKLEREEKLKKRHQFMTTLRSGTRVAEGSKANYFKQFKPLLDDTASRKSSLHALGPTLLFPESQGQSLVPAVNDFGRKLSMLSIAPDEGGNLPKSRTLQAVSASSKRQVDGDLTSVQEVTISSPEHDQPIQKPRRIVSKYGISVHPKSVKPALQILSSNRLILPMLASLDREIISLDRSAVFWEPSLAPPLNVSTKFGGLFNI
ncbi:hypothetical protein BC830DRAFT_874254 [Chytriomyces sp. MP71]|nr:hypothetical protein BC830DRAFT_874254 [Chytriomyces sp. MP71]